MNSRLPPWNKINPRPRLNVSYRQFNSTGSNTGAGHRWLVSPIIKLDYRWKKEVVIDFEIGFDYLTYNPGAQQRDQKKTSLRMGYNYTF